MARPSIRFWDASAIVKVFDSSEPDHRRALGLWFGPKARQVLHATSALAALETLRRTYRTNPGHVEELKEGLDELDMIYVDERVLEIAFELAKTSNASGADTAIVACAVAVARESSKEVEFVTADSDQKNLVLSQEMGVIQLSGERRVQTTDKEPRTKNYFRG